MKKKFLIPLTLFVFAACSKDSGTTYNNDNPPPPPVENPPSGSAGDVVVQGSFINGAHTTNGTAKVLNQNGSLSIRLENFNTESGPDLKVYLSTDKTASTFLNLGNLKSISGAQSYTISGNPDFNNFKYCLIWCQQFAVLFGSAELK